MKTALELQTKYGTTIFQAHELLEIAIEIMKKKWEEASKTHFSFTLGIAGVDGEYHSPRKLSDFSSPEETVTHWLAVATSLKQGADNKARRENDKKQELFTDELQLGLVEYYQDKLEELEHLTVNTLTKPIWDFWKDEINEEITALLGLAKQGKCEDLHLRKAINKINSYLNLTETRNAEANENKTKAQKFIEMFSNTYIEKCQKLADQTCLTHVRCLFSGSPDFKDKTIPAWDNSYNDLFEFFSSTLVENLNLNLDTQISHKDLCYFVAHVRSSLSSNLSLNLLKSEIELAGNKLKMTSQNYQLRERLEQAKNLINKRKSLYIRHNQVVFLMQIMDTDICPQLKKPKNFVGKLWICVEALNRWNSSDIDCIETFKKLTSTTHQINTAYDYYTILRLFVRNGLDITEIKTELFESFLKRVRKAKFGCDDFCTATQDVEKRLAAKKLTPAEHIHDPQIAFYSIGKRIIGINQHHASKGRYVYDYGQNTESLTQEYLACADIEKNVLIKIDEAAKTSKDHAKFIDIFLNIYEQILLKNILFDGEATVSINKLKIAYNDLDAIKKVLKTSAEIFKTEALKIEYIYKIAKTYIVEHLCFEKRFFLQMSQEKKYDINTLRCRDVVSYPQIFRALPNKEPSTTIATTMRSLLKGETQLDDSSKAIGILTATWFLAETSRNPLTFLITLMMLDLVESRYPYNSDMSTKKTYTWKKILLSPETAEIEDPDERRKRFPQEEGEGGKHPMCHIESYIRYFKNDQWPLSDELEFVRQKEATILINWLKFAITQYCPHVKAVVHLNFNKEKKEQYSRENCVFYSYKISRLPAVENTALKTRMMRAIIEPLLVERLKHFNNLLSQTLAPAAIALPETTLSVLEHKAYFLFFRRTDEYIYTHKHESQREFDQRFGLTVIQS